MTFLRLIYEFFKTGLFAVGGGLATLPFLYEISERYGWFSSDDIANMIAVSESTPGPVGINMATFAGIRTAGIGGGIAATLALVCAPVIITMIISSFLKRFQNSIIVESTLSALRPASCALICSAVLGVAKISFLTQDFSGLFGVLDVRCLTVALIIYAALKIFKGHPIFYIISGALFGIILEL